MPSRNARGPRGLRTARVGIEATEREREKGGGRASIATLIASCLNIMSRGRHANGCTALEV